MSCRCLSGTSLASMTTRGVPKHEADFDVRDGCRRTPSRRGCRTSHDRRVRYLCFRAPPWRGRRRWVCRSTVSISMSAMVAAEQLVDEGAVHLVCPFGGRLMLEFHRVTRCPTWAAEASPCAGTSMPCNPIVPEVPFGGELLSVISPLLPLGEVDDEGSISTCMLI